MKSLSLLVAGFLLILHVRAQEVGTCETGQALSSLYINNVQARIYNDGRLFGCGNAPNYVVPKGEGVNAICMASLAVGGYVAGDLRFAGAMYGPGEFWPGPLENAGSPPSDCTPYDRIYEITKADMLLYERTGEVDANLRDWPWHLGAPVIDGDGVAGNYNLSGGDRPALKGHQTLWWVMNDAGNVHHFTGTAPMGLEVQVTVFAGRGREEAVENATFYHYRLINKNTAALDSTYLGLFLHPALGVVDDDYMGADTTLDLAFAYNSDNHDKGGYGDNPPALGFQVLQGPIAQEDGVDNNRDGRVDEQGERLGMTNFIHIYAGGGDSGSPVNGAEYYDHLNSFYRYHRPATFGGNGRVIPGEPVAIMYPGDPVTRAFWSELNIDGQGSKGWTEGRQAFMSTGPFRIPPEGVQEVTFAIVWARGADYLDSITRLREAARTVREFAEGGYGFRLPLTFFPTTGPELLAPYDGAVGQPDALRLNWQPQSTASAYQVQVAEDSKFEKRIMDEIVSEEPALALKGLGLERTYYWRVRGFSAGGFGRWRTATFSTGTEPLRLLGPWMLSNGQPAFVEVMGPGGAYPCADDPEVGCAEVGARVIFYQENSTGDFLMEGFNTERAASTLLAPGPNSFEIRFTEEGSFGHQLFLGSRARVLHVPFEIWDIGVTPIGKPNDTADDVQLIPVVSSQAGGHCVWAYGEVTQEEGHPGWQGADRILAYYPANSYDAWAQVVEPIVSREVSGCPIFIDGQNYIDTDRGRVMQSIVFYGNPNGPNYREEGPPVGTVVRFYTNHRAPAPPILSGPEHGAEDRTSPLTLWWTSQRGSSGEQLRLRVQVAEESGFHVPVIDVRIREDRWQVAGLVGGRSYYWRVRVEEPFLESNSWSEARRFSLARTTSREEHDVPAIFKLDQNYPNPFNSSTAIRFTLPSASPVRLVVYDVLGREVARLVDGVLKAGTHEAVWQAKGVGSGLYVYRIEAGAHRAERKMLLVR